MPRIALVLLVALALAGCDSGSDTDRFVGTWDGAFLEETTVVSTVDQRYQGFDIRGEGTIEITGDVEATITQPEGGLIGAASWQLQSQDESVVLGIYDEGGFLTLREPGRGIVEVYQLPALAGTVDVATLTATVTEQTVALEQDGVAVGEVTIGGQLRARTLDVPTGVPTTLPAAERAFSVTLTLNPDGTAVRTPSDGTPDTGTWEADGDAVILTFPADGESQTYDLIDGQLVRFGQVDAEQNTGLVERQRGLQTGSLTSARSTFSTVYTRAG